MQGLQSTRLKEGSIFHFHPAGVAGGAVAARRLDAKSGPGADTLNEKGGKGWKLDFFCQPNQPIAIAVRRYFTTPSSKEWFELVYFKGHELGASEGRPEVRGKWG